MEKTITQLDDYCRMHNRVLIKKEIKFLEMKNVMWIVDNSDDYEVGQ